MYLEIYDEQSVLWGGKSTPASGEYSGLGVYCSMLIIGITLLGVVMACILEFAIHESGE